ncbi:class I SAM-dependent methyltransferase [Candidatus Woesearchaeota archaeon]|nr:class I SAM-dependent methyltransferase [Candidatus Woesearchaeota archaeon]
MAQCHICQGNLIPFLSLGKMPAANGFLKKEDLKKKEYLFHLQTGFCENCKMVQLTELVPYNKYIVPDKENKTHYAFFSSTSKFMEQHFAVFAQDIEKRFLKKGSQVLEIGSNDGIMLKAFKNHKVLGIEPSWNTAEVARKIGIETLTEFFAVPLAKQIAQKRKFKAIVSANVILNIHDLNEVLEGVKILLEEDGVFVFEDPYIMDILAETAYDQIYDEHIYYFSLTSLSNLLAGHDLEIFDAQHQETHGGSMRVYTARKGKYKLTENVKKFLALEKQKGIDTLKPYQEFAKRVERSKKELVTLLTKLKKQGKKIVGYAAASKGTIVLNYCDIGPDIIAYIADSTPEKQGKLSPGKHIPIVAPEVFKKDKADYALLGAWNHAKEIMGKEKEFLARGGRFIVHTPKAMILEPELKS